MAIFNLGSVNIDHVYRVPHLPEPGETLASISFKSGLGGKGANQSIAIGRAGGTVHHIGAIGTEGDWTRGILRESGVNVEHLRTVEVPTGHAIINVDDAGENAIVLFSGANVALTKKQVDTSLAQAKSGDWLVLQNETNLGVYAAKVAQKRGMKIAYSAAPFSAVAAAKMLPLTDLLAVNEIEATQLAAAGLSATKTLITKGAKGAEFDDVSISAFKVNPVDTTGAGDTFFGYFMAALDSGRSSQTALLQATAASALQVTRYGAADAIPTMTEVAEFIEENR